MANYDDDEKDSITRAIENLGPVMPAPVLEKKPEVIPGLVLDDLKIGMHLKLKCGCEGFANRVATSDYREERWFSFIPTKIVCSSDAKINLEYYYSEFPMDSKIDTYHADSFPGVFPAFECPAPAWFPSFTATPKSSNEKRAIRIRVHEGVDFLIPGCLMNDKVFKVANAIREAAPSFWEVEVVEVQEGIPADSMKTAVSLFEKISKAPNRSIEDRNVDVLYNWFLAALYHIGKEMPLSIEGTSLVTRDKIKQVLASVAKHPLWQQNSIEIVSKEGYMVSLKSDGTIQ
jgi:hypothetical protein